MTRRTLPLVIGFAIPLLAASLDAFHVPARERHELLAAVAALRDQIVGQ